MGFGAAAGGGVAGGWSEPTGGLAGGRVTVLAVTVAVVPPAGVALAAGSVLGGNGGNSGAAGLHKFCCCTKLATIPAAAVAFGPGPAPAAAAAAAAAAATTSLLAAARLAPLLWVGDLPALAGGGFSVAPALRLPCFRALFGVSAVKSLIPSLNSPSSARLASDDFGIESMPKKVGGDKLKNARQPEVHTS
jgi:hypothetical protein